MALGDRPACTCFGSFEVAFALQAVTVLVVVREAGWGKALELERRLLEVNCPLPVQI